MHLDTSQLCTYCQNLIFAVQQISKYLHTWLEQLAKLDHCQFQESNKLIMQLLRDLQELKGKQIYLLPDLSSLNSTLLRHLHCKESKAYRTQKDLITRLCLMQLPQQHHHTQHSHIHPKRLTSIRFREQCLWLRNKH